MPQDEAWDKVRDEVSCLAYRLPGTDRLIRSGTMLGDDYCRFALPIVQLQLAKSAVRLAATLKRDLQVIAGQHRAVV
jgi:hypothetical protein